MGVCTGTFKLANGSPVANGLYQWKLSGDAIQSSTACIAPPLFNGRLDSSGAMTATFLFNDALVTTFGTSTTYQLTIKDAGGSQVWNEEYYLTGTAANLNIYPPGGTPMITATVAGITTPRTGLIGYNFSGGGTAVSAAVFGAVYLPVAMTPTGWVMSADRTGSAVLAVLVTSYANYPLSMTAIAAPTMAGAIIAENVTLTASALPAATMLTFSVTSASTVQTLNVGMIMSIPYA